MCLLCAVFCMHLGLLLDSVSTQRSILVLVQNQSCEACTVVALCIPHSEKLSEVKCSLAWAPPWLPAASSVAHCSGVFWGVFSCESLLHVDLHCALGAAGQPGTGRTPEPECNDKDQARLQGHTVTSDSLHQSHRAEPKPRAGEVSRETQDGVWLQMCKCYKFPTATD